MSTRYLPAVATTAALAAMFAVTAAGQATQTLQTKPPKTAFLTPLPSRFVIPPGDPRQPPYCRQLLAPLQCPPLLVYGGNAGGGLPTIDPAFKALLPNVRVSLVVQEMWNEALLNGGVGTDSYPYLWFTTSGSAADDESGGPWSFVPPGPDEGPWVFDDFALVIYDALVFGECGSFSSFPIDHTASIVEGNVDEIGAFHGVDNSTLDSTGFYNFRYKVHATASDGGVSDYHISGKVNVTCSAANTL